MAVRFDHRKFAGFATGDAEKDASSVRLFIEDGHQVAIAQSFSKNMGLYGERIGALTLITCRNSIKIMNPCSCALCSVQGRTGKSQLANENRH